MIGAVLADPFAESFGVVGESFGVVPPDAVLLAESFEPRPELESPFSLSERLTCCFFACQSSEIAQSHK